MDKNLSSLPTFKQFQSQFTKHLRHPKRDKKPEKTSSKRMKIYNELVFNGFEDVLSGCFPVLKKILKTKKWEKLVRDFIIEHSCQTPFYRQIPDEFIDYLQNERKENRMDPPFLLSLAHYEWMELVLHLSTQETDLSIIDTKGDLLENYPVFASPVTLLSYPYPVHQLGPRLQPKKPSRELFYYLLFRNNKDQVRFIVLNPISARLIDLLLNRSEKKKNLTAKKALAEIAKELKHPDPKIVLQGGLKVLNELKIEGAILGVYKK